MLIELPSLQTGNVNTNRDLALMQPTKRLETGQVTKAVVVAASIDGNVTLSIEGGQVQAKSHHHLHVGEELEVQVTKEDGADVLKILNKQFSTQVLNEALRQVLPNQNTATRLMSQMLQLLQSTDVLSNLELPDDVQQQLQRLINRLPTQQQLQDGNSLRASLENAGTFLESKLASSTIGHNPAIHRDFKSQLLNLLKVLDTAIASAKTKTSANNPSQTAGDVAEKVGRSQQTIPPSGPSATHQTATEQISRLSVRATPATLSADQTQILEQASRLKQASTQLRTPVNPTSAQNPDQPAAPQTVLRQQLPGAVTQSVVVSNTQGGTSGRPSDNPLPQASQNSGLAHAAIPVRGAVPQPPSFNSQGPENQPLVQHPLDAMEQLKDEVSKTLARVQANQLTALPRENHPQPYFLVDLPVKIDEAKTEVIPFLIQEEPNETTGQEEGKQWSIMLALDLEHLGSLQLKATQKGEHVSINIWSDLPETKALFERSNALLEEALQEEGVNLSRVSYHGGLKPNDIDSSTIRVLDLKA